MTLSEGDAVYCRTCGKRLTSNARGTVKGLASSLALGVSRVDNSENLLGEFEVLREVRRGLSSLETDSSQRELETLALYSATCSLRAINPQMTIAVEVVREMVDLYRKSLVFRDVVPSEADEAAKRCLARFDEYDRAIAEFVSDPVRDPSRWFLKLAMEASRHCYGVETHGKAVFELTLMLGYFIKIFGGIIESRLQGATS